MLNPLLHKDLLFMFRQTRLVVLQGLFVLVMAVLLVASWPQQGVASLASRVQDDLLLGLSIGQAVLLALFVPGVGAVLLTSEKEAGTMEMLYASPLSPMQIVFGKIASCLSFPLVLLTSGLPLVALLSWRGVVNLQQLLLIYLILALTGVLVAALSLTVSALCAHSASALVSSYVLVLTLFGASLVPAAIMLETQAGPTAALLHYSRGMSPVAAILALLRPNPGDFDGSLHGFGSLCRVFIFTAGSMSVGCFAILARRLSSPPASEITAATSDPDTKRSFAKRLLLLIDASKSRKPYAGSNPVLAKERRTNVLWSARWMIRIFYAMLCFSMALALMSLSGGAEHPDLLSYVVRTMVVAQIVLIGVIVPSLTSAAVSSELENNTFESLRVTPLTSGKIFWGKLLPALLPAFLLIVAVLPAYATLCYIDPGYWPFLIRLGPVIGLAIVLCAAAGMVCSSFTPNVARASVSSYVIVAAMFVLPLAAWAMAGTQLDDRPAGWLAMPSPLVMGFSVMDKQSPWRPIVDLWGPHVAVMSGVCMLFILIARLRLAKLLRLGE